MNCSWYDYGFWFGGPLIGQIIWILILIGLGYLIFRLITGHRSAPAISGPDYPSGISLERCPNCNATIEKTFIRCPECHFKLKINCPNCGKIVKTDWDICPYCETNLQNNKQ